MQDLACFSSSPISCFIMLNMTENLCLRYHMHSILNITERESLHAITSTSKELFMIYEKMN